MKIKIDGKEYELSERIDYDVQPWYGFCEGEIITQTYRCPLCGEGKYVHVDEDTPGDRDHFCWLDCEKCNPDHLKYTNSGILSSWDLRSMSDEEVKEKLRLRAEWDLL